MKPGVNPVVLRVAARIAGFALMLVCELLLSGKVSVELYGKLYGLGGFIAGGTFISELFGQMDGVKLQELHDSMQPPPPDDARSE